MVCKSSRSVERSIAWSIDSLIFVQPVYKIVMTETAMVFEPSRFGVYEDYESGWMSYFGDYGSYQYGEEHAHEKIVTFDHRIRYEPMAKEVDVSLFIDGQYSEYLFGALEMSDDSEGMKI